MIDYNDGKWHGWNGGACPVHPDTVVMVKSVIGSEWEKSACNLIWHKYDGAGTIIAFRVVKEHKEPVVTTHEGECWAYHFASQEPTTASCNAGGDSIHGAWTATHVDGKLQSFTWTADND